VIIPPRRGEPVTVDGVPSTRFATFLESITEQLETNETAVTNLTTSTTTTTTTASNRWEIVTFSGNYSPSAPDAGKLLISTSGSATDFTINSGVFELGDQLVVWQYGAGQVTVVAGSGTTIRTPTTLTINEQYGSVTLIMGLSEEWMIAGRMTP
jgi:hypothetical protein